LKWPSIIFLPIPLMIDGFGGEEGSEREGQLLKKLDRPLYLDGFFKMVVRFQTVPQIIDHPKVAAVGLGTGSLVKAFYFQKLSISWCWCIFFYFLKFISRLFQKQACHSDNFVQLLVFLSHRRISSCHYRTNGHIWCWCLKLLSLGIVFFRLMIKFVVCISSLFLIILPSDSNTFIGSSFLYFPTDL
jgi:hypothetical protein